MGDVVKQNSFRAWILAVRPKTLSGACVPVVVASSLAYADHVFLWQPALLCLMFAILMQIAANFVNDYLKEVIRLHSCLAPCPSKDLKEECPRYGKWKTCQLIGEISS